MAGGLNWVRRAERSVIGAVDDSPLQSTATSSSRPKSSKLKGWFYLHKPIRLGCYLNLFSFAIELLSGYLVTYEVHFSNAF